MIGSLVAQHQGNKYNSVNLYFFLNTGGIGLGKHLMHEFVSFMRERASRMRISGRLMSSIPLLLYTPGLDLR